MVKNIDEKTVKSFGSEWSKLDQAELSDAEREYLFNLYFSIFPWQTISPDAEGFDMGCGSGRWAKLVAPRVGTLNCIDASDEALTVAKNNLSGYSNIRFFHADTEACTLRSGSQDFGYCLGVLHHIPDTFEALRSCVRLLKHGAPLLIYIYYRFENRPYWYKATWHLIDPIRAAVSRLPESVKYPITDFIAAFIYFPLSRISLIGERLGFNMKNSPLYAYRNNSFYTMRTDSRDRFGTPLEKRFSQAEIRDMMDRAGLVDIMFSDHEPYWCAIGIKSGISQ